MISKVILAIVALLSCQLAFATRHLELQRRFEAISKESKSVRPRSNGATTKVNVTAELLSVDLDPMTAKAQVRALLKIYWEDGRLAWDNKAYRTDTMWVDPEKLWTPDVAIFNRLRE